MQFSKFFYSAIYTRPSQLWARLWLLIKRRGNERFSGFRNNRFKNRSISYTLNQNPPKPVFRHRTGFFDITDKSGAVFSLTFLNESRSFSLPVNWHDKTLEKGTRLWKLHLHYMEYLEEVNDEWFTLLITDWITQNPPYKKGYYLDSWNSYALSIRVVVWMQQLSRRKDELEKAFYHMACRSIYKQLDFLEHNIEKDIRGNHIIKNIKALLWGSQFFGKNKQVRRWQKLGEALLKKELKEQILPDGMHFERSPSYHNQVLADFLECYHVLMNKALQERLQNVLLQMGKVMQQLTHPDEKPSLFNDGGLNMSYSPNQLLQALEEQLGFRKSKEEKIFLPAAGYYGFNKHGNYILCDAGKIAPDYLPAHGHGDIFSFEWTVEKYRIFIDKGVYEYNSGGRRKASRSTLSHNTVNIDREDQCEFWGSFRVAKRADIKVIEEKFYENGFSLEAFHTGYKRLKGQPCHRRKISFDGTNLDITDSIERGKGQPAEARFLLHPDVLVGRGQEGNYVIERGSAKFEFETSGMIAIIDSVWFPDFGVERKCKQIAVNMGSVPCKTVHKITRIT